MRSRQASCTLLAVAVAVACVTTFVHAPRAAACTFPAPPETRFFLFEAPVGGLWWVHGFVTGPTLALTDTDGNVVDVDVVSPGAQASKALRVPNVAVGTRFALPDTFDRPQGGSFDQELVVAAGAPTVGDEPPQVPAIAVESREARVGYTSVIVSPIGGECTQAMGFWNFHYDELPFLLVDDPGGDVVLDIQLQPPDEAPFEAAESANEILFDARRSEPLELFINTPPDTEDIFVVNARVRRIADGVASEVASVEVTLDDIPAEERIEWVGCSCAHGSPTSLLPWSIALVALRFARRRRARTASSR